MMTYAAGSFGDDTILCITLLQYLHFLFYQIYPMITGKCLLVRKGTGEVSRLTTPSMLAWIGGADWGKESGMTSPLRPRSYCSHEGMCHSIILVQQPLVLSNLSLLTPDGNCTTYTICLIIIPPPPPSPSHSKLTSCTIQMTVFVDSLGSSQCSPTPSRTPRSSTTIRT